MFGYLRSLLQGEDEYEVDLSQTPWKLCLVSKHRPLEVFLYYATHKEARDQEDISVSKGWMSAGIKWYDK